MFSVDVILSNHKEALRQVLRRVEKIIPMDWERIEGLLAQNWPIEGKSAGEAIVQKPIRRKCYPYVPFLALSRAPNHLSSFANVLAFKMADSQISKPAALYFPFSLSIFPTGRQVLELYSLVLDSQAEL